MTESYVGSRRFEIQALTLLALAAKAAREASRGKA